MIVVERIAFIKSVKGCENAGGHGWIDDLLQFRLNSIAARN